MARYVFALVVAFSSALTAQTPEKNDYSTPETWLCRPGKANDACSVDLTTTVIAVVTLLVLLRVRKAPEPLVIVAAGVVGVLLNRS